MDYGYLNNISAKTKFLNFCRQLFFIKPLEKFLVASNIKKQAKSVFNKLIPNHYQYAPKSYRLEQRDGINYRLDLSELNEWYLYYGFKDESRTTLINLINEGDFIVDIGANLGEVSLMGAKKVGPHGKVFSFEPDPLNYTRLEYNYSLNEFANVDIIRKGLGDEEGSFKIAMNQKEPGNNGSNSIIPKHGEIVEGLYRDINVIRFDDWIDEVKPSKIDLIKMDIEGYEMQALSGSEKSLMKYKPTIFTELHDVKLREHGSSAKEMLVYLETLGYQITAGEKVDFDSDFKDIHVDIICKFPN